MIELQPGHWVHAQDLRGPVLGREDPEHLIERCVDYFERRDFSRSSSSVKAFRAKGRLLSAKVRKVAAPRPAEELRKKQEIIDRLLAFVPRRSENLPEERLLAISREVAAAAVESFGTGSYVPVVADETDPESAAAHRITLYAMPDAFEPEAWAQSAFQLHRWMAEALPLEESQAVSLVVVPEEPSGSS